MCILFKVLIVYLYGLSSIITIINQKTVISIDKKCSRIKAGGVRTYFQIKRKPKTKNNPKKTTTTTNTRKNASTYRKIQI